MELLLDVGKDLEREAVAIKNGSFSLGILTRKQTRVKKRPDVYCFLGIRAEGKESGKRRRR